MRLAPAKLPPKAYRLSLQGKDSIDNAYVQQDKDSVSAEMGRAIVSVMAKEGQQDKAGDVLFVVDQQPFQIQLAQADAVIARAQANATALASSSALSGGVISAARDDIGFARSNYERQRALWGRGFTTKAAFQAAQHQLAQAKESLKLAEVKQTEARAKPATGTQVPGVLPAIAPAQAQRQAAELNLSLTIVWAPISIRMDQQLPD